MNEELKIIISATTAELQKGIDDAKNSIQSMGEETQSQGGKMDGMLSTLSGGWDALGAAAVAAAAVAIAALVDWIAQGWELYNVQEFVEMKLEKLGENSGWTNEQVQGIKDLASALQETGVIGDEVALSGANVFAQFGATEEQIKTLLPSVEDLAVGLYGVNVSQSQMESTSKAVAKAMEGSYGALEKMGLTLSEDEEKWLDNASAQEKAEFLARKINDTYGGMNKTMANTSQGAMQQMNNALGDLGEAIGAKVAPIVQSFAGFVMSSVLPLIESVINVVDGVLNPVLQLLTNVIFPALGFVIQNVVVPVFEFFGAMVDGIASTVVGIIVSMAGDLGNQWNNIKTACLTAWENIKIGVSNLVNGIKTTISNIWNGIKNFLIGIWNGIKNTAMSAWNGIKTFIINPILNAKTNISNAVESIKTKFSNIWTSIKNTTKSKFEAIKNAIQEPIENAKEKVKSAIDKIKSFFNFSWSLPKLKLPHLNITGSFSLVPPSTPKFSIDWYKQGGIFDNPTLIGVGEAGKEAVMPLERNTGWITELANKLNNTGGSNKPVVVNLVLDKQKLGTATINSINDIIRQSGEVPLHIF